MGIMKDGSGNLIFITHALSNFTRGFNNRIYNYQMILPIRNGTTPTYYFFTDPNDICPEGEENCLMWGMLKVMQPRVPGKC